MADNVTTQTSSLATVPGSIIFRTYTDAGGVEYFPVLFLTSSSGPPWTFQGVDNISAGHGLPVQALAGAIAQLPAGLGQAAMAASLPVVLPSNQSAVPISGNLTGNQAVNLAQVGGSALALGQAAKASSVPVALPSDAKVKNTIQGSQITALTGANLNGLSNNNTQLSSAINWTQGQTADGYLWGRVEMTFKFQVAPTANTGFSVWFLKTGSALEDSSAPPCRAPDLVIPVTPYGASTDTSAHNVSIDAPIPVGTIKVLIKNDGTGQTLTANNTDNVLYITPITTQQNV
jgi:hypothetical protein